MMCGLIDLNTVNNEDDTVSLSGSPSSSAASGNFELAATSSTSVCMELWHACAGPLISLPKKGSAVVYFPQGHVEHLPEHPAVAYDLPPHVFCRVVDVKLHADAASDEVYAQVSLVPDQQIEQKWREGKIEAELDDEDPEGIGKSMTPHMFCKTLTASDTSTHGGFSVPRRAAEDCFPPLDYKQQRPSQELVAKDLHGIEWKFRHIYRGQPRRHLLTTGWSAFVNKKKLVSGDAVLFLRGGDGELRLGIRRAAQVKSGVTVLPPTSQQFNASTLAAVVNAISMRSIFTISYNPRARSSEIIVPYHKFSKSLAHSFSCGMRIKIRCETEDSSERRCSGVIIGVSDVDRARWPGSKWKCLLVRWDDMEVNHLNRVSPWEIEPSGSMPGTNSFILPGTKRSRVGYPASKPDLPVSRDGNEVSDFGEPLRFHKVLQGQEVFGFSTPYAGAEVSRQHPSDMRCYPGLGGTRIRIGGNSFRHHQADARNSLEHAVLGESFQFRKVLQGQETASILSYGRGPEANQVLQDKNAANVITGVKVPCHGNSWSTLTQVYNTNTHPSPSTLPGSSPPSALLLQQSSSPPSQFTSLHYGNQKKLETCNMDSFCVPQRILKKNASLDSSSMKEDLQGHRSMGGLDEHRHTAFSHLPVPTQPFFRDNQNLVSICKSSCRLFGFPLTEGKVTAGKGDNPAASASAYGHEMNALPRNEEQLYQPPLMPKVIVSSCTKASDMHVVRDRLLDIAL
ncbi:UNVERIFIED_CONTAM: Auxin response factor 3 [Sesamum radiatum]|uniref:Auxin response factor n=1 Tax=Sesamum radiatum TaxID=300843 RepID=A0AAW2T267_SESRA